MKGVKAFARELAGSLLHGSVLLIWIISFGRDEMLALPPWTAAAFWTGFVLVAAGVFAGPWIGRAPAALRALPMAGGALVFGTLVWRYSTTGRIGVILYMAGAMAVAGVAAVLLGRLHSRQHAKDMAEREAAIARGETPAHHPALDWRDPTATW